MKRIEWIDTTKAIGIFLVFYGHYIERMIHMEGGNGIAKFQFGFIYSFHMPMFFILSGFFAKKQSNKIEYAKKLFFQRIIPVLFFGVLFIPLWLFYNWYSNGNLLLESVIKKCLYYLGGNPQLDFITWFLICLFTTELISVLLGLVSNKKRINLITGLFFLVLGYIIVEKIPFISEYTRVEMNFWYVHESIIALGFYLIGNWLFPILENIHTEKKWLFYLIAPVALLLIKLTNTFLENERTVIMAISQHGEFSPFVVGAFLGTVLLISIGMIIPSNRIMNFIGSNTLILLGLNGIFHHFINSSLAKWSYVHDSWWYITINCFIVSLLSIAICYSFIE